MTGDGFTTKEIVLKVWEEVRELREEVKEGFAQDRERLDSLEADRDKGFWPRKWGAAVATAVITGIVGIIVGMAT